MKNYPIPNPDKIKEMIFTQTLRIEMANALGFKSDEEDNKIRARQRMKFLDAVDWDDPANLDKATKLYINHVAANIYNDMHPDSKYLTVSWGSPSSEPVDPKAPEGDEKLVRPQLRIMVKDDYDDDERIANSDLPYASYTLTYTPPESEKETSEQTAAFMQRLRATIQNDLGIEIATPEPHEIYSIGAEPEATEPHETNGEPTITPDKNVPELIVSNVYDNEGVSVDITLPADAMVEGFINIVSKGRREAPGVIPDWADYADKEKDRKSKPSEGRED